MKAIKRFGKFLDWFWNVYLSPGDRLGLLMIISFVMLAGGLLGTAIFESDTLILSALAIVAVKWCLIIVWSLIKKARKTWNQWVEVDRREKQQLIDQLAGTKKNWGQRG